MVKGKAKYDSNRLRSNEMKEVSSRIQQSVVISNIDILIYIDVDQESSANFH